MSDHLLHYIDGHGRADRVSEFTALPHRVARFSAAGVSIIAVRPRQGEQEEVAFISDTEFRLLAREERRARWRRFWWEIFGRDETKPSGRAKADQEKIDRARQIRRALEPMRHDDGSLDTGKVAYELTMRQVSGLPGYIAELDGPGKVN